MIVRSSRCGRWVLAPADVRLSGEEMVGGWDCVLLGGRASRGAGLARKSKGGPRGRRWYPIAGLDAATPCCSSLGEALAVVGLFHRTSVLLLSHGLLSHGYSCHDWRYNGSYSVVLRQPLWEPDLVTSRKLKIYISTRNVETAHSRCPGPLVLPGQFVYIDDCHLPWSSTRDLPSLTTAHVGIIARRHPYPHVAK